MNSKYAKIENGLLIPLPNPLRLGDRDCYNPTAETAIDAGYLPVVETEPPTAAEGEAPKYYTAVYEEADGQIVQSWVESEPPAASSAPPTTGSNAPDPIPYEAGMELKRGLCYSQGGVTYRCNQDTGQSVYHDLGALVGLYVGVVG